MRNAQSIQTSEVTAKLDAKYNSQSVLLKTIIQNKWFYLMLVPGLVYLFIFNYIPMYGITIGFKNFDLVKGIWESPWVGFKHFQDMFSSPEFYTIFKNSILISLYRILWGFPAPIILAIALNEVKNRLFKQSVQTMIYLPHFISWVVVAGMVYNFLSPSSGLVNHIIQFFGGEPIAFLQKPQYFRSIVVISDIWKETGWGTVLFLAALSGVNYELYESAFIDGATRLQVIRYITIPSIMSTIVVVFVMRMGTVLKNGFEQIFLLYNPLVYDVADIFETYTYRLGLLEGRYDYSTAIGLLQSVIGFVLIIITNRMASKRYQSGLW